MGRGAEEDEEIRVMEVIAQITAPHFCAGIVLLDSEVVHVAPIVKYMLGWSRDKVRSYCREKKWKVTVVRTIRA